MLCSEGNENDPWSPLQRNTAIKAWFLFIFHPINIFKGLGVYFCFCTSKLCRLRVSSPRPHFQHVHNIHKTMSGVSNISLLCHNNAVLLVLKFSAFISVISFVTYDVIKSLKKKRKETKIPKSAFSLLLTVPRVLTSFSLVHFVCLSYCRDKVIVDITEITYSNI